MSRVLRVIAGMLVGATLAIGLVLLLLQLLPDPVSTVPAAHLHLPTHTATAALLHQQSNPQIARRLYGSHSVQLQEAAVDCCLVVAALPCAAALRWGRMLQRRR